MRYLIFILMLTLAGVGAALAGDSSPPERYIGKEGYKDARWGFTPAQVKRALPGFNLREYRPGTDAAGEKITRLFYREEEHFFRPELKVLLLFDHDDGLYGVEFYERQPLDYRDRKYRKKRRTLMYNKVWTTALKTKFGDNAGGVMDCDEKTYKSETGCVAWWELPETVIRLRYKDMQPSPWGDDPIVRYRSTVLTKNHFAPDSLAGPKPQKPKTAEAEPCSLDMAMAPPPAKAEPAPQKSPADSSDCQDK